MIGGLVLGLVFRVVKTKLYIGKTTINYTKNTKMEEGGKHAKESNEHNY